MFSNFFVFVVICFLFSYHLPRTSFWTHPTSKFPKVCAVQEPFPVYFSKLGCSSVFVQRVLHCRRWDLTEFSRINHGVVCRSFPVFSKLAKSTKQKIKNWNNNSLLMIWFLNSELWKTIKITMMRVCNCLFDKSSVMQSWRCLIWTLSQEGCKIDARNWHLPIRVWHLFKVPYKLNDFGKDVRPDTSSKFCALSTSETETKFSNERKYKC